MNAVSDRAGSVRVCYVVEPGIDGVFRQVEGLIARIADVPGFEIAGLAYSDRRGSPELDKLVATLRDKKIATLNLQVGNQPELRDVIAIFRLRRFIAQLASSGDLLIHAHSSKAGALARFTRLLGCSQPVIYTPHGYYGMSANTTLWRRMLFNCIESFLGRGGATVCVSESERAFARVFLGLPRSDSTVVYNGVDLERFRPPSVLEKLKARELFGLPAKAIVIGVVGRYSWQKDPDTFYKAIEEICSDDPRIWVLHCGGGSEFDRYDQSLSRVRHRERLVRVRHLMDTSVAYQAMDIFALTSRYEGFSLSAIEAAASGLPLVLTRCSGNVDLIRLGLDRVYWATVGEPSEVAEALRQACKGLGGPGLNHRRVIAAALGKSEELNGYRSLYRALGVFFSGVTV